MECLHRRTPPGSGAALHVIGDQADEHQRLTCDSGISIEAKCPRGRPRRRQPDGFVLAFIKLGEHELPDLYRAGMRTVRRWRDEAGREQLRAARRAYVIAQRQLRRREKQRLRRRREGC